MNSPLSHDRGFQLLEHSPDEIMLLNAAIVDFSCENLCEKTFQNIQNLMFMKKYASQRSSYINRIQCFEEVRKLKFYAYESVGRRFESC